MADLFGRRRVFMAALVLFVVRNRELGVWGALGGFRATAGLLIGGVITSLLSWEWMFFSGVTIGLAILALCPVGLAAGLVGTLITIGSALGIAVVTSVASGTSAAVAPLADGSTVRGHL